MVVLAASIVTKTGKVLLSRQYVDITRARIEGLLTTFPKLCAAQPASGQHTLIETESVRYVYQPLEALYVLLITNKNSNIVEDLETLKLLAQIIPEYCRAAEEQYVIEKSFQLIFAFDEVLSQGYPENVTLNQVRTLLEMDSHDERMAELEEQRKLKDAQEEAKRKIKALDEARAQSLRAGRGIGYGAGSISGGGMGGGGERRSHSQPRDEYVPPLVEQKKEKSSGMVLAGGRKGLKLGGKKGGGKNDFLAALEAEGEVSPQVEDKGRSTREKRGRKGPAKDEKIHILLEEMVTGVVKGMDGTCDRMLVNGKAKIKLAPEYQDVNVHVYVKRGKVKFKPVINPKLDFEDGHLSKAQPDRSFPSSMMKWNYELKGAMAPIVVAVWPGDENDGLHEYMVEYKVGEDAPPLDNVLITIPVGSRPQNMECVGDARYKSGTITWNIGDIDEKRKGTLEFAVECEDPEELFPMNVNFISQELFSGLSIGAVEDGDEEGEAIKFSTAIQCGVTSYEIVA